MKTGTSKPNQQILEEASSWFVDFRLEEVGAGGREEFHQWLRRSPEHIQAYMDIARTYAEIPAPSPDGKLDVQALIAYAHSTADPKVIALHTAVNHPAGTSEARERGRFPKRRRNASLQIAAALALAILGAWLLTERNTYATGVGEQRSLALADGSTVDLNSDSRMKVRYSDGERRIELLEGQALFHVEKDKSRPFIVQTGGMQVRAVGTQFDVYRKQKGTVVTVVEGRVSVVSRSRQDPPGSAQQSAAQGIETGTGAGEIVLAMGEQLIVKPDSVEKSPHANVAAAIAWTSRQLIFDATPLTEVAEEFNRYSTRRLIVDEVQLSDFHVSGTYSSTNPDSLVRFLRAQPGVRLIETDESIRVTRE